jgi:hypothetical protein
MTFEKIHLPKHGTAITVAADLTLNVPNDPIIPFIEGDGIGVDVPPAMILRGWKFMQVKRRPRYMAVINGYPKKPLMLLSNLLFQSKAL